MEVLRRRKKICPLKTLWGELSPVGEIGEFEHVSCVFGWSQISCAKSKPWCNEINQCDRKPGQFFPLAKNDIKMPFCVLFCNLFGAAKIVVGTALNSPCKNWLCVPSWDLEASTPGSNICESNLLLGLINYFLQRTYGGMVMMMMKMTKMTKRKTKMASLTGWQASVSSSVNSGTKIKMGNWMLMKSRSGSFLKIMTIAQPRPNTWLRLLMLIRFVVCGVWKLQSASFENDLSLLLRMCLFFSAVINCHDFFPCFVLSLWTWSAARFVNYLCTVISGLHLNVTELVYSTTAWKNKNNNKLHFYSALLNCIGPKFFPTQCK